MRRELNDQGISLIEVVIAVMVLSIGVIAGFQSLGQARRGIGEELPRVLAHQAALNHAEELQMLGAGSSAQKEATLGGIVWTLEVETAPTEAGFVEARVRASADGHPGAMLVVYAPAGPPQ